MRLLIVDDSAMFLKHTSNVLSAAGVPVEILTAQRGDGVLELVRSEGIDILLLDIVMPGIGGIDLLRSIKEDPDTSAAEVLMFSSLTDKQTLRMCFELGATDYITKPIDEVELLARVKSVIKKKNLEREKAAQVKEIEAQNASLRDLNLRLNDAKGQLLQQEKMAGVGHLAAGVAHEINNPLGFVISNVKTLQGYSGKYKKLAEMVQGLLAAGEEELPPQLLIPYRAMKEYVQKTNLQFMNEDLEDIFKDTNEGLDRVGRIVRGLRNFSRVDHLDEFSLYDLNEGVENTLIISRNELKYAAQLELELTPVPEIYAAGGQINQVILNLLLNAIAAVRERYAPALGWIGIRTWAEGEKVFLRVQDNGVGIPEEYLRSIFDPFFTTKPVGEGTGLGLSISYDIVVNKHRGWIEVKSEPGEGTEFLVTLPIGSPEMKPV